MEGLGRLAFGSSHALFVCFVGLWRFHNGRFVLIVEVPPTRMGAVKALLPLMRDLAVAGVGGVVSWSCANDNKDNQHHTVSYHQPNQLFQLLFLEGQQISLPFACYGKEISGNVIIIEEGITKIMIQLQQSF